MIGADTGSHKAYLAGPEVFLPNAMEIGRAKIAICAERGLEAAFPLVSLESAPTDRHERGHYVFKQCVDMMDECTLVIANMTPFRGVSMDVGTAVEVGYMFARGKRVFGYTNVLEHYSARVPNDGMEPESFGFADNLMCEGPVWQSGGVVIRMHSDPGELFTDLRGFTLCVEQAAAVLGIRGQTPSTY